MVGQRSRSWTGTHHRHRGQIIVIAPVAILAFVGMLGMVVDLAFFQLLRSEMQNAADAAALASVRYDPICPYAPPDYLSCASDNAANKAPTVARDYAGDPASARYNGSLVRTLCASSPVVSPQPGVLRRPAVAPAMTVVITCEAGWFGARLFGLGPIEIWVTSTAAIGGPVDGSGASPDLPKPGRMSCGYCPRYESCRTERSL